MACRQPEQPPVVPEGKRGKKGGPPALLPLCPSGALASSLSPSSLRKCWAQTEESRQTNERGGRRLCFCSPRPRTTGGGRAGWASAARWLGSPLPLTPQACCLQQARIVIPLTACTTCSSQRLGLQARLEGNKRESSVNVAGEERVNVNNGGYLS